MKSDAKLQNAVSLRFGQGWNYCRKEGSPSNAKMNSDARQLGLLACLIFGLDENLI